MKPIAIHPLASAELEEAADYYELQKKGLGNDLLAEVLRLFKNIQQNPEAGSPHKSTGFRCRLTRRFPYVVYYAELKDRIWISAIAHGMRRPDYWRRRKVE